MFAYCLSKIIDEHNMRENIPIVSGYKILAVNLTSLKRQIARSVIIALKSTGLTTINCVTAKGNTRKKE